VGTALLSNLILLAEKAADAPKPQGGSNIVMMLMPWIAIGFLFYLLLIRPQRQEQAKRKEMLAAVKKNDRVITAGGIHGVVANVNADANEVTVKVDESTGTKLRFTFNSISHVITDEASNDASK